MAEQRFRKPSIPVRFWLSAPMLQAIIFDLDDTLLQTRQTKYTAIKYAGEHFYGLTISDACIDAHWGKPYLTFIAEVFGNIDTPSNISTKYKSIIHKYPNRAYHDALDTIETLSLTYKLAILSSLAKPILTYDMQTAGIPIEPFTYIQSEEDTNIHKPHPEVFNPLINIMKKHCISPIEMLYVGDTRYDFEAATRAGLHFVGMADRTIKKADFDALRARSISTLSQLPSLGKIITH